MVRSLHREDVGWARYGAGSAVLAGSIVLSAIVAVYSMFQSPHDVVGSFAEDRMAATQEVDTGDVPDGEWHSYGRTAAGRRYSPLDQITPDNVDRLTVAWTYQTGDVRGPDDPGEATYEVTPLMIDNTVYICTPHNLVIALDAVTGAEKWRFDPLLKQSSKETTQHLTCRGVGYHDGSATQGTQPLQAEAGANAQAISRADLVERSAADVTTQSAGVPQNVVTGKAQPGDPNPVVDRETPTTATASRCRLREAHLRADLGRTPDRAERRDRRRSAPASAARTARSTCGPTCPTSRPDPTTRPRRRSSPTRLLIVGGTVNDNVSTTSPSGVIRAYDVNTGELVWNLDSKNPDATAPYRQRTRPIRRTRPTPGASRAMMPELGLIYLPMGNQSPDQYGGGRSAERRKILLVDPRAAMPIRERSRGSIRPCTTICGTWTLPAQPSLVDLTIGGQTVPALVAPTKQGEMFVLDRRTGEPVLPVKEVPGAYRRGGGRSHGADPAGLGRLLQPAGPDGKGHVGRHATRPAGMPHRLQPATTMRGATRRLRRRARSSIPAISAPSTGARWRSTPIARSCSACRSIWPSRRSWCPGRTRPRGS